MPPCLPPCLIVAGPTASGKSALALRLAERFGGTVINADAMQCYRELRVITARPSEADEARVPHRLYGTRGAAIAGSAASWRADAIAAIEAAHRAGRLPILCGGTGLYLATLAGGLADIPDPGAAAREEARALLASLGAAALHERLAAADPHTASRLRPSDGQRIARAWEVWRGTGRPLAAWQADAATLPAAPYRFASLLFRPDRAALRGRIVARFDAMLASGARDEVAALLALGLAPSLPAMRAHGVPELAAHLRGEIGLDEARRRAIAATARYTKRQDTWFRHHEPFEILWIFQTLLDEADNAQLSESLDGVIRMFLQSTG